ncbi:MAG: NAD(P)/FAD-dependent oxidoreductase [Actinomycetota bacterium]|nr:NAD(P)/FAD-dependent oxidoreductase [Actinomycetota bacterium]
MSDAAAPLPEHVDVLVLGAGQAGLAAGYWLTREPGLRVLVVERGGVGQSWLDRWDSLVLFTPRSFSSLPGLPFPSGRTRSPDRSEFAAYLRAYAERFDLPVRTGVDVHLLRGQDGAFVAETSQGAVRAAHVVVATGPFQRPHVPEAADALAPEVVQLHSYGYRSPAQLPAGDVLVVGGGNSAAQLAVELAATHWVTVASPGPPWYLPVSLLGVDLYWWTWLTGVLDARSDSRVARYVQRRGDAVVGTELRELVRAGTVRLLPHRVTGAHGRCVRLADGSALAVSSVLWCTGFRPDTDWIDVPGALDADGAPVHEAGASPVPGLHWMGLPWQTRLNSSIIHGTDGDAHALARRVRARQAGTVDPLRSTRRPRG